MLEAELYVRANSNPEEPVVHRHLFRRQDIPSFRGNGNRFTPYLSGGDNRTVKIFHYISVFNGRLSLSQTLSRAVNFTFSLKKLTKYYPYLQVYMVYGFDAFKCKDLYHCSGNLLLRGQQ